VEAACEEGAGLIVVGTHRRSWWQRLVLPELARRIVDTADSSVVVVPMCA
jgi:nucleotide-binding universal stress UspA family protein